MKPLFDVELSPESIDHFKIGALKVKLRTDRDQTSVFRIENWQKTNTIIQYIRLQEQEHSLSRFFLAWLFSFEVTSISRIESVIRVFILRQKFKNFFNLIKF